MQCIRNFSLILLVSILASCSEASIDYSRVRNNRDVVQATVVVDEFCTGTKNNTTDCIRHLWSASDKIGIFSHLVSGGEYQDMPQLCLTHTGNTDDEYAYFSSGAGWKLIPDGKYKYCAYFPHELHNSHDEITLNYLNQTQLYNDSTTMLYRYDYMYSSAVIPNNPDETSFAMHHIGVVANIRITLPESLKGTRISSASIIAESNVLVATQKYNIASVADDGMPDFRDISYTDILTVSFPETITQSEDNEISVWFMMSPAQLQGEKLMVKLYKEYQPHAAIAAGSFSCGENQEAGHIYTYRANVCECNPTHPDKPSPGNILKVLLVGNSHSQDTYTYIYPLMKAAGITNVNMSYIYRGGGTLQHHYEHHINGEDVPFYKYSVDGSCEVIDRTFAEILADTDWDVVAFQQLSGEITYSQYQPYLNALVSLVRQTGESVHHKIPFIAFNATWSTTGGGSSEAVEKQMFTVMQKAFKDMSDDTGISWIAPTGKTIENLRNSSLKTPELFLRDGVHLSYGIGRYAASCAWFEAIIKPIYGVSVVGNSYRPSAESASYPGDQVTESNIQLIWECVSDAMTTE